MKREKHVKLVIIVLELSIKFLYKVQQTYENQIQSAAYLDSSVDCFHEMHWCFRTELKMNSARAVVQWVW